MGKKKNKNKVTGAAKTAAKTEKKLTNKLKKERANLGEEDIAKVLAEIELEEAKRSVTTEKMLPGPPSPRAYATLTPHPITNELILFGGEYHDGRKTAVYNELLLYNPDKGTWKQVKAPGAPPPRSAHQAVATAANKGELWVFGGEFTSPSETQFHHYKDLWRFSFADRTWEKVRASGGPCARSGHRMCAAGRRLVVVGGHRDEGRGARYFDDVHVFELDARAWTKLAPAGRAPSARAAALLLPAPRDSVLLYGGFSRERSGRAEVARTHSDQFRLSVEGAGAWQARAPGAGAPPPRAAQAAAAGLDHRGYVFGGVADVEETEEDIRGELSNDLHVLDLESGRWRELRLRGAPRPGAAPAPAAAAAPDAAAPAAAAPVRSEREGFTLTLGGAGAGEAEEAPEARAAREARFGWPCPRMSAMLAVQRGLLYVYGGVLEKDDRQFYLGDLYSLDLNRLTEWKTLIPQGDLPEWLGSDSDRDSDDDDDSGDDDSDDGDDE